MKRVVALTLLGVLLFTSQSWFTVTLRAAWDKGFNFRLSGSYVTDAGDTTYVVGEVYPITRNSVTFGWDSDRTSDARNRSTSVDVRLAGINQVGSGTGVFTVDLPNTGTYKVRLAMGDVGNGQTSTIVIKDNTTTRLTIGPHAVAADWAYDAADVTYTHAAWPGSNSFSSNLTFASTAFKLELSGTNGVIQHLYISEITAAAGGTGRTLLGWIGR